MHHYRILLHDNREPLRFVLGLPMPINPPTNSSYMVHSDKIVGEKERQAALNYYRAVHGRCNAITVSECFDEPLPQTVIDTNLTFTINGKEYCWELRFNEKTQAHDCTLKAQIIP